MATRDPVKHAASKDPAIGLTALHELRMLIARLEPLQVRNARTAGWSWERIAEHLGVSRQNLHAKYSRMDWARVAAPDGVNPRMETR